MSYPPDDHVMRDLALEIESRPDDTATGWLPITPAVMTADDEPEPGALAVLVDVLGGGLSIRAALPDWAATADLSLQLVDGRVRAGDVVEATARVVRKGRTTLVIEVDLRAGGVPLGWGTMTFAVVSRRSDIVGLPAPPDEPTRLAFATPGAATPDTPLADRVGMTVVEPGVASLAWSPYISNSLGATQGGVVAMLGAVAGRSALAAPVRDLHVAYLAQARHGPFVARADVLGPGAAAVRLTDEGDGARLLTVVHVGTAVAR